MSMEQFTQELHTLLSNGDTLCHFEREQRVGKSPLIDDTRFRSWEWNYGKSPEASFSKTRKFPCGTVTVSYSLVHGCLHNVRFNGDFIGSADVSALEKRLEGAPLATCHLEPAEKSLPQLVQDSSSFFDGVSPDDLTAFLRNC
jgi:lipoate-protein ligase A